MSIQKVSIKNFKAIKETVFELKQFNVIDGTNGSGKSSALQAIHWAVQSGRNLEVKPNRYRDTGSTLSERHATYMPSPDYRNASHSGEYGNFQNAGKMEVEISTLLPIMGEPPKTISANIWIKAARNEGLSVHIPSNNPVTRQIRNTQREYSCYIPGLAGVPLSEEKKALSIVMRQAASGDANTVLRNLLLLLHLDRNNVKYGLTKLNEVEHWASKVLGPIFLTVKFNEKKDYSIKVNFQTYEMAQNRLPAKPLELAGIGFLQVIQIFAYFVYFKPRLLLADEPDSHLHPDRQEKLVNVMREATDEYETQVILTTHSPNVVRSLPQDSNLLWMKSGEVAPDAEEIRSQMGWGLLDKKILILAEDKNSSILRNLIHQWPSIESKIAIWPLHGISKAPSPDSLSEMRRVFGGSLQLVLHRDSDFLTNSERDIWAKPYQDKGITTWVTKGSDVEAYFVQLKYIQAVLGIGKDEAKSIRKRAKVEITDWEKKFNEKRREINKNDKIYIGGAGTPSNADVLDEICAGKSYSHKKFVGKSLVTKIRKIAQEDKIESASSFGKYIPSDVNLADDLKVILESLL